MATAEEAAASAGPRYAPDDPSLPKPWKCLIDGSAVYYWNPETNVTQYEKPTALPPPLPSGPPPLPATPNLAQIPGSQMTQPNGIPAQHGQEQQGEIPQLYQQHIQQMPQVSQQGSVAGPAMQQHGQLAPQHFRPQMMQQPSQQMFPFPYQKMPPQQANQVPQQAAHQVPQQMGQQAPKYQNDQLGQPQDYQYSHQQMQYMAYQQNMPHQEQQVLPQQTQQTHGQQFAYQQEHKAGFPLRDDVDFQQGKQVGFSPSHAKQTGLPFAQNSPAGTSSDPMPQMGVQQGQTTQFGGPPPFSHMQGGMDLGYQQHGPRFQNQMGPGYMHAQQSYVPAAGSKMGYEEQPPGRVGNEHHFGANKDVHSMGPQQPKLATIPLARNQMGPRMGGPLQNASPARPGGPNIGPSSQGIYNHAMGGPPFPHNVLNRPPSMILGSPNAMNLTAAEVYRQNHEVTATGDNVPAPFMSFEATGFPPELLREIYAAGFSAPTPIQAQTWPIALQNKDIVAIAKTGSGKTLGYLIPAFMLLRHCRNNPQIGPTVVVLAPTRELATQIHDEAIKFGRSSRISCVCLFGGVQKGLQLKELDRGVDIVVATPGRLNDILEMKKIDFRQVSLLVLDEADRMLDMGFEPQIRKIVNEVPSRRQTLMYTATWPKEVRKIASDLLVNPVQVNIGNVDELAANKSITQYVEVVPQFDKQRRLEHILRTQERGSKIIVFCSTKKMCDTLAYNIGRNFGAAAIHGDKSQADRDWVLNEFRSGKCPILVATDVAARGLDIKDIRVVVNYDFPTGVEDYVHRIGRTGRAGATGLAYTFFSEQDWKHAPELVKVLEGANQAVPDEIRQIAERGGPNFSRDRGGGGMIRPDPSGAGRFDSGSRGGRDGGFGGRGGREGNFGGHGGSFGGRDGMRDDSFGGRGGMRDGGFGGGRGGMRDGGFGGRGGGMRDGNFGDRGGMRDGNFGGRGGSRGGGGGGWDRNERGGPNDRYNRIDGGRGRGGRGRFDNRADRSGGRSYSPSPERVRTWSGRSRSRSYSRSRSGSWSRSRSRSPRRSRSWSRSRSRTPPRRERRRESKFDQMDAAVPVVANVPPESGGPSLTAPSTQSSVFPGTEHVNHHQFESIPLEHRKSVLDPSVPPTQP